MFSVTNSYNINVVIGVLHQYCVVDDKTREHLLNFSQHKLIKMIIIVSCVRYRLAGSRKRTERISKFTSYTKIAQPTIRIAEGS